MGNYIITSKSHDEWLRCREQGIGSSEVATVLGVNPYDTPYQLWKRKTGQVQSQEQENFLMKAGHYLEDAISRFCADEAGLEVEESSAAEFVVVDEEKPFLRVSPDRYAFPVDAEHTQENKTIIECKSTQKAVDPDNISLYWFCQVMYQMRVTQIGSAHLAWFTMGRDFGYKRLSYDPDFAQFIEEEVERFWVDCVLGGREPELSNVQDVLIKFPKHEEGKKVFASDNAVEMWAELCDTNDEIKRLTAHKEEIESALKMQMLDGEVLVVAASDEAPEKYLATWKASKPTRKFDADALKKAEPEVYARYLREVKGPRRFSLKQ